MINIKYEKYKCITSDKAITELKNYFPKNKSKYFRFKPFKENYLNALMLKVLNKKKYFVFDPQLIGYEEKPIVIAKHDNNKFNLQDCKSYLADISQLYNTYDTTKELEKILISLKLLKKKNRLVDFGCGFGSVIQYLSSKYKEPEFLGYDKNKKIIDIAKVFTKKKKVKFFSANFLNPTDIKIVKNVSCLLSIHTLCCFKQPELFIKSSIKLKPKFIIIKSLFYDGSMNTFIHTEELNESNKKNIDGDLNIFSKKMIIDIYRRNNYRFYSYKPFYMKKKIVKNKNLGRGSYTISYNNRLNTFTGPIHLPWGFLILKKDN